MKKMMARLLMLLLVFSLVFVAACSGNNASESSSETADPAIVQAEQEKIAAEEAAAQAEEEAAAAREAAQAALEKAEAEKLAAQQALDEAKTAEEKAAAEQALVDAKLAEEQATQASKEVAEASAKAIEEANKAAAAAKAAAATKAAAAAKAAESAKPKEKEVVIRLWAAGDWLKGDESAGQQTIKEFNEKYKGKIRVEGTQNPWEQHNAAMQAAFSSGDLPDLFHMPQGSELNQLIAQKLIRPVDGIVSDAWYDTFSPGSFADGVNRIDGRTYTWPLTGPQLMYMLYYNKDVLKDAGFDPNLPPRTWDEMRLIMQAVTKRGKGDVYGMVYAGGAADYTTRIIAGLAQGIDPYQSESGLNLKTGKYTLADPAWNEALQFILSVKKDGSILPSSYSLKAQEASVLFGQGKAAFLMDARWRMWQLKRDTPNANFGMTYYPTKRKSSSLPYSGYNSATSTGTIVVSAKTKYPEAVGKFIEEAFAAEPFYKRYMADGVALTPLPAVNDNTNNYPYPEYADFVRLHNQLLRNLPSPFVRNPDIALVSQEMGGVKQNKVKPSLDQVFQSIMSGAENNPSETLNVLNNKLNTGLVNAINAAKSKGAKVSESDFEFPNWDPTKHYTQKDYLNLK
jgi:ABC-type glycerol-3-phosphate transport system substrate-binding protein